MDPSAVGPLVNYDFAPRIKQHVLWEEWDDKS